jgi:hypothetical protein
MALVCRARDDGSYVSAHQSHEPVLYACGKHHLQGVWGAARPPSGEREGQSPLASHSQSGVSAAGAPAAGQAYMLYWTPKQ